MKVIPTKRSSRGDVTVLVPGMEEIEDSMIAHMPLQFERDLVHALKRIDDDERQDTFVLFASLPLVDGQNGIWTTPYGMHYNATRDEVLLVGLVSIFLNWTYHDPLAKPDAAPKTAARRLICSPFTGMYQRYRTEMGDAPNELMRTVELSRWIFHEISVEIRKAVEALERDAAELRANLAKTEQHREILLRYHNPRN